MSGGIIKEKKKKENFFTVVRNRLIELIASRCPGGQKNLVSKRDKTRTEPVIWVQTKTRPACLCHVLCFSLELFPTGCRQRLDAGTNGLSSCMELTFLSMFFIFRNCQMF